MPAPETNITPGLSLPDNIRFSLATRESGHFGKFEPNHPRVTVNPNECPVSPTMPEDDGYWPKFESVVDEVGMAKANAPYRHATADCFEEEGVIRADQAGHLVNGDWPPDLAMIMAKSAFNANDSEWRDIVPGAFVDKIALLSSLIGTLPHITCANSGAFKWTHECARPQEIAWLIANRKISCPSIIEVKLRELEGWSEMQKGSIFTHSKHFTLDSAGAPPHPSWIAMHAAGAEAAAFAIRVNFQLGENSLNQNILAVNNIGGFRKTLGVHFDEDNIAGYWLGQETAKRFLPEYYSQFEDADMDLLEEAMVDAEIDWLESY